MINITSHFSIPESEIEEQFVRASGPGGQHLNKSSTAVQLRFNVANSPYLPEDVRQRLMAIAGQRLTDEGVLVIEAKRFRQQDRNRQDARRRLIHLIRVAARKPKVRKKGNAPRVSREKRLQEKRRRSETKRQRRLPPRGFD